MALHWDRELQLMVKPRRRQENWAILMCVLFCRFSSENTLTLIVKIFFLSRRKTIAKIRMPRKSAGGLSPLPPWRYS